MTVSSSKVKKLARELLKENRKGRSWRTIAKQDFDNTVDQSTLSRIARNKGAWVPKDEGILFALGLAVPKAPKPKVVLLPWQVTVKKKIAVMAKKTREDLGLRKR
jgi:hypothetical protein